MKKSHWIVVFCLAFPLLFIISCGGDKDIAGDTAVPEQSVSVELTSDSQISDSPESADPVEGSVEPTGDAKPASPPADEAVAAEEEENRRQDDSVPVEVKSFTLNILAGEAVPAVVFIDGTRAGTFPWEGLLPLKETVLKIVPDDPRYKEYYEVLRPREAGERIVRNIILPARWGSVAISGGTGVKGVFYIDGEEYWEFPEEIELRVGTHRIKLVAEIEGRMVEAEESVEIEEDRRVELEIPMGGSSGNSAGSSVAGDFILVEGGRYTMGSDTDEADDNPEHSVTLSSFYISSYEVTQKLYSDVTGTNPSVGPRGDEIPVNEVAWKDAIHFCNLLSEREGLMPVYREESSGTVWIEGADGYRLPTEAEWEYAARGGLESRGYLYAGTDTLSEAAEVSGDGSGAVYAVGTGIPNELGLYDMSGNVYEWCWDIWDEDSYIGSPGQNPRGPGSGADRVVRGGSASASAKYHRTVHRGYNPSYWGAPTIGFRLVRSK